MNEDADIPVSVRRNSLTDAAPETGMELEMVAAQANIK